MRRLKTIQLYILLELCKVFLMGVSVVTALMFLFMSLKLSSKYRLQLNELIGLVGYIIPTVLYFTVPFAVLIAVIFAYGRMVADNEVLAMTAGGVNLSHVVAPALLLGTVFSFAMFGMNHTVIPRCKRVIRNSTIQNINFVRRKLHEDHKWEFGRTKIIVDSISPDGSVLNGVIIRSRKKHSSGEMEDTVIKAEQALFSRGDGPGKIMVVLIKGTHRVKVGNEIKYFTSFERHRIQYDLLRIKGRKLEEDEVVTSELRFLRAREKSLIAVEKNKRERSKRSKLVIKYSLELGSRTSNAVSCLVFAILGVPIGIRGRLKNLLSALAVAMVPLLVVYYPLQLLGRGFAEAGRLPVPIAVWASDIILGLLGSALMVHLLWRQRID